MQRRSPRLVIGRPRASVRHAAALEVIRAYIGYHAARARWSATVDELAALADRIFRTEAGSLGDVVVKFEVLAWMLIDDGAVIDQVARHQIIGFRHEIARLAAP